MNRFKVYSGKDELLKVNDKYKKDNTYQPFSSYNSVNPGEEETPEEQNQNYYNYYNNYNNYSNQQQSGKSYADYVNQISEQGKLLPDLLVGDKKEEDKGNFFERAFATLKELPLDIQQGVFQWGSNIAKSVGSGGVKLGEWYGANINYDEFNKFLATDYATKLSQSKPISFINDPINTIAGKYDDKSFYEQTLNQSYISDSPFAQNYIRGGAEQIGNMLPSIALSYVNPTLGKVSFGLSAAGGGIEEAIQSGATFDQALVYGVATGVLETAIEGISGGIGGVGEGLIGNILKETGDATIAKLTTNTLVKFAANTIGEGLEEVASELINPYLKRVTFDPDAPTASTQSVLQSFILGALCSAVLQGGNIALTSEVKQEFQKINELTEFQAEAYDKGRFADADAIGKMIESKTERLGEALQNNPEMQKLIKTSQSISKVSALNKVANRTDFSNYQETYTKLQDMISQDLQQMKKEERAEFIKQNKLDFMYTKQGKLKANFAKLTTEQQKEAIKVVKNVSKLDSDVKFEFFNNKTRNNGYYSKAENKIYINFSADDPYRVVGLHEFTHSLEGSQSYYNLRDFIIKNLKKQNKYASEFKKSRALYKSTFDDTSKVIDLKSKLQKGEITQQEYYDQYNNMLRNYVEEEMVAKTISEDIFTDENTINELVNRNESLGKRILKWINNKIKGTEPEFNAWRKELKTAKKLYQEAIKEKQQRVEEEKNFKIKVDSDKVQNYSEEERKYSLKENVDSEGNKLSKEQVEFFNNVDPKLLDKDGRLKPFYHGTQRMDRVGYIFDPKRATSGPMAFFSDSKEIATNYSTSKRDTSLYYEDYDSYSKWFKYKNTKTDFVKSWLFYPEFKQKEFIEKASHITLDDDSENIIYDENTNNGLGNYKQALREYRNNAFGALIDGWLESGTLINEEHKFMEVLKLLGLENNYTYDSPNQVKSGVFEVYLNITNAFDTSNVNQEIIDDLEKLAPKHKEEELIFDSGSDMWDKNTPYNQQAFIDRLKEDLQKGTTYAWTSIPDYVTNYLKNKGYDGIIDKGGKYTDNIHDVAVPFYSNQVKDINNLNPTSKDDIRYSLKEKRPKGSKVENTKNIPSDYVTGKAEAKQDKVYSKQEAQDIYEELIHSIATESGIAIDNDVETKVVNYIFQQLNTNKTTTVQIAEKVANYVFKNADISTDLPVDVKNDLMQEFKDHLATQVFYGGKESFRYKTQQDKLKMEARMKTMRETLKEKIAELKEKNKLYKQLYKESRTVAGKIAKLKEYSSRDYMDIAGAEKIADMLQKGVTIISNITDKNFYKAKTRKVIQDLRNKWYNDSNELIKVDENLVAEFNNILQNIDSKENLSLEEVKSLKRILSSMIKEIQEYDKVRIAGKEESIKQLAEEGLEQTIFAPKKTKLFNSEIMKLARKLVVKDSTYFKALEGTVLNEKGVLSKLLIDEKNRCEIQFYKNIMDLSDPFDKFFKKNKKFKNSLKQKKINVGGVELNKAQAISVYMLSLRKQARGHFMSDVDKNAKGLEIYDEKGKYIANVILTQQEIDALYEKFDDTDKEYIALVHEFFNKHARELKKNTDIRIMGSTNIMEENYFPIITDEHATYKNLGDPRSENLDSLFGLSFNEDVIEGANSEIKLMGVDTMVFSHLQKVARYNAYMEYVKTVRQVMNRKIPTRESNNREVSLLGELDKAYPGFTNRLNKYLQDSVTSVKINSDEDKFIAKVRKNFASYTLGLKLSTVVNQFTIIPTAINVLSPESVLKAATTKLGKGNADLMNDYSVYAKYRNYSGAVKSGEINVESKLNAFQDLLLAPMTWGDKATTRYIWRACQIEAKSRYGYEYGTEENLTKAAELLEEVMRKTQALDASEQPELFRSDSQLIRTILLFQKQNIQTLSTVTDYISQHRTIKQRLKVDNTEENRAKLKEINKNGAKAITGLLAANLGYTLIATLFKYIKGTDDKDKEMVPEFLSDFVGNTVGMIPIFNIVYDKLFEGYDMSLSVMDVFNDGADALMGMIDAIQTGNVREKWYKFVNAFGMATGIPTKNILNTVEVFIRPFNPDLAYKFRSMFYNKTVSEYTAVLEKSIQERDIKTTSSILEQIYTEKGIDLDSNVTSKLSAIISSYKVQNKSILIPKTANQTFTFDSTEYELTDKEYRQFKKKYSENINKYLNSFMSNAKYATLKTEEKAQAIKYLQDYAYFKSIKQIKGVDTFEANKLTLLDKVINPVLAATVLAKCKGELKGDKAKIQQYINSLSVTREQKYLLYGMLGYKPLQDNAYVQVSNYLSTKGYTINQIQTILEECKFIEKIEY